MNKEYEYLKNELSHADGFIKNLPIHLETIETGYVRASLEVSKAIKNPFGSVHGGCLYSIADTIAGIAAMTHGNYVTTTSGQIHYFVPITADDIVFIDTTELKVGKNLLCYDVNFYDRKETLLCKATIEFFSLQEIENNSLTPH